MSIMLYLISTLLMPQNHISYVYHMQIDDSQKGIHIFQTLVTKKSIGINHYYLDAVTGSFYNDKVIEIKEKDLEKELGKRELDGFDELEDFVLTGDVLQKSNEKLSKKVKQTLTFIWNKDRSAPKNNDIVFPTEEIKVKAKIFGDDCWFFGYDEKTIMIWQKKLD